MVCAKAVPAIAVRARTNRPIIGQFAEEFPTRLFEWNNMGVTIKRGNEALLVVLIVALTAPADARRWQNNIR
jgi:hypothetical protein